jgi:hypothetical protein
MVFTRPAGLLIPLGREIPENDQDHDAGVKVRNASLDLLYITIP